VTGAGGSRIRTVISAGGIIFRRQPTGLEIFFIKDPFARYTFPKGKQELGETLVQTSIREIREETGLHNLRFVAPIGKTSFRFRREGYTYEKIVYFFLFEAPKDARETLTGNGAIWEGAWVKAHQAFAMSSYRNLDRLLSKALRLIAQEERQHRRRPGVSAFPRAS
jgi:ADP-ribose pyrophosphatase YjhB (NUDIX family)